MNLVIVESPTKARTIGRFLGKGYEVKASMGHLMDLPKSTLGVDTERNFKPLFEVVADKKKIIADLKKSAKNAKSIILATDPDREGEAIAAHVAELLTNNAKKSIRENSRKDSSRKFEISRIVFHEITKEAIEEALQSPRSIDANLVDAQTARRVLDRLVGYKLSPLLWQKVRRGLSAGRVQSVALRLIVEREREIESFKKETYWTIRADLSSTASVLKSVSFELIEINGEKIETSETLNLYDGEYTVSKTIIGREERAQEIINELTKSDFIVSDVIQKEARRSPAPPYTTSTLQQDAARRLGLNGKHTMSLAQKLYEEGFITYHRTDSVTIAESARLATINYIKETFGEKYLPEKPRFYVTKQKLAQEAHEAIRPTKLKVSKQVVAQDLGNAFAQLYDLIWKRALASQMSDAVLESTTVIVDSTVQNDDKENVYRFKANGSVLVFDGFLKVNPQSLQETKLPRFKVSEKLEAEKIEKEYHETPPPPRYNDASLIKTLEEKGIGRPSTYASIVSTIMDRLYAEKDEGKFVPTPVGTAVNGFLVKNFKDIDDIPFTAEMEDGLDEIASGKKKWAPIIKDFYGPFEKKLKEVEGSERVKIAVEETDELCPKCGSKLVVRTGKFGKFLSCSSFPKCDFSKAFVEETNLACPKCKTRLDLPEEKKGKIIIKKTRRGRKFFGCSNYPACDFAAWRIEDIKKES